MIIYIPRTEYIFAIETNDINIEKIIFDMFSPYVYDKMPCDRDCISFFVEKNAIRISYQDKSRVVCCDNLLICKLSQIVRSFIKPEKGWNFFHGASVIIDGKCFVVLAESGMGKSTLVAYLSYKQNAILVSEDILIINPSENIIVPFPRPIHLRKPTIDLLQDSYGIHLPVLYQEEGEYDRFVYMPMNVANEPTKIQFFMNIKRIDSDEFSIKERSEGASVFWRNAFLTSNVHTSIADGIFLEHRNKVYDVEYRDLNVFYEKIKGLWRQE